MATVRELQASFSAKINEMESSIGKLKQEIGSIAKETEKTNKSASNNWDKMGDKIQSQGKKISDMGGKVQKFGKKWTKMTSIVAGAATGLGTAVFALTNRITKNADEIAIQSRQMGVSTDFYQEMDYWANQNGMSQEQMQKAIGRLNQRMGRAADGNQKYSDALEALGINMDDVRDGSISTEDAFTQSIQTLSEMDNEQEKAAKATELFGTRMARQLLPALQDGSMSMEEAKERAQELGLVMSEDQIKAAEEFQASYDDIKASLGAVGREIGLSLMPYMQKAMDRVMGNMPQIKETVSDAFDTAVGGIRNLVNWFRNLSPTAKKAAGLFAGIAAAIGPVSIAIGSLMKIFGPLTTVIGKGASAIGKFGGLLPALKVGFAALTGPVGLTVTAIAGLATAFVTAYKKSETFRNIVNQTFQVVKNIVVAVVQEVVGFVQQLGNKLLQFWQENGDQITQALQNIWGFVQPIFQKILGLFQKVFPLALSIVKSVWGNIKGVIQGALDVILGVVKTFSSLFTGDFKEMWEGIKQIFSGAIKAVWNFIQLQFFGRIVKGAKVFLKAFTKPIKSMWNGIKDIFMTVIKFIVNFVKKRFTAMKNTVTTIFQSVKSFFTTIWNGIKNIFMTIVKSVVNFVKSRFTNLKNNVTTIFNGIKSVAQKVWEGIKRVVINPVKNLVSTAKSKFNGFKNKVAEIFGNIKDSVAEKVTGMIDLIKGMPGKMKKAVKKGAGAVKNGFLAIARKIVDGIASGVNGLRKGVKWALDKIGMGDKVWAKWKPENKLDWYAKGTKGHPTDSLAVVGDGKGRNAGSELITEPDGSQYLSPNKPTVMPMKQGTHVTPAKTTNEMLENIPRFASGGILSALKTGAQKTGSAIKKGGEKAWSGVKTAGDKTWSGIKWVGGKAKDGAKALINAGLKKFGITIPSGEGSMKHFFKGTFNKVKDYSIDFMKDKLKGIFSSDKGSGNYSGATSWGGKIRQASTMMGAGANESEINGIISQINRESNGNPKAIQSSNVVDINTLQGNPARGLLQYIPESFNSYKVPGFGDIMNGMHQLMAFFNNTNWRSDLPYGKSGWGPTGAKKFANGGIVDTKQLAWIADGGWAESIISHDPAKRNSQRAIWEKTGDALGFKDDKYSKNVLNELKRIAEAIEQDHDLSVVMNDRVVGEMVEKHVTRQQKRKGYRERMS